MKCGGGDGGRESVTLQFSQASLSQTPCQVSFAVGIRPYSSVSRKPEWPRLMGLWGQPAAFYSFLAGSPFPHPSFFGGEVSDTLHCLMLSRGHSVSGVGLCHHSI